MNHKEMQSNSEYKESHDSNTFENQNAKLGIENKSSLMTTVTTANKLEDKHLCPMKFGVFYSQIFPSHTKTRSIASVNKFDQNFPGFEKDIENVSYMISDDHKDQEVNVNVSNLDFENSMIKGIERLETMFQLTNTNRNLTTNEGKNSQVKTEQQSILSIEDSNNKQSSKQNEKKKLIIGNKDSNSFVIKKRTVILISLIVVFVTICILALFFFIY